MLSVVLPLLLVAVTGCSEESAYQSPVEPGHGALRIAVEPNPIVAERVEGKTYDFPFTVVVSNPGSAPVEIERVTVDVTALGGIPIHSDARSASEIRAMGYATTIPANQTVSYQFNPRKEVPSDSLFGGVSAVLAASGTDAVGKQVTASTRVSVTR